MGGMAVKGKAEAETGTNQAKSLLVARAFASFVKCNCACSRQWLGTDLNVNVAMEMRFWLPSAFKGKGGGNGGWKALIRNATRSTCVSGKTIASSVNSVSGTWCLALTLARIGVIN